MTGPLRKWCGVAMIAGVVLAGGCSRPDPNAPVRITGDKGKAIPTTAVTTTTSTTEPPSTTLYYGPGGPGETLPDPSTTTTTVAPTTTAK
ncbi:MAG: hypothetical protein U0Q22_06940 [Acidimicrobiales bacterium]